MNRRWTGLALAVGGVLAATAAVAQPLGVPPGRWWERPKVAQELAVTAEQKAKLEGLAVTHARKMVDLKAAVEKAELELRIVAETEPFDARAARQGFAQVQQARARLEAERFELLVSQREVLSAEQWRKLRDLAREVVERRRSEEGEVEGGKPPRRPPGVRRF
jgi:Spy/CpxP family protein refolding chaperone